LAIRDPTPCICGFAARFLSRSISFLPIAHFDGFATTLKVKAVAERLRSADSQGWRPENLLHGLSPITKDDWFKMWFAIQNVHSSHTSKGYKDPNNAEGLRIAEGLFGAPIGG